MQQPSQIPFLGYFFSPKNTPPKTQIKKPTNTVYVLVGLFIYTERKKY